MLSIKKEIADLKRAEKILSVFFKYEFGPTIKKIKLFSLVKKRKAIQSGDSHAVRLRKAFEELGGSFIKFGQMLSLRPDLVSHEFAEEFSRLRDRAKPFPTKQAKQIIEKELGEVFKSISDKPVASASIGQVYDAELKSGERVAVKVRRPGVNKLFHSDIHILFCIAKLVNKYLEPESFDPVEIVREFQKFTIRELDYVREAKNIETFHENFRKVLIPKVFWQYTTPDIITMSFLEGRELSDVFDSDDYDKTLICETIMECFFKQIFLDGFFHGDPHPANIIVIDSSTIGLLDFGVCRFIGNHTKKSLEEMCAAIVAEDYEAIPSILLDIGFVQEPLNMEKFKEELVESFMQYRDSSLKFVSLSRILEKMIVLFREYKIKLPSSFILLLRTVSTLESNCMYLDPNFDFLQAAQPFIEKQKMNRLSPKSILRKTEKYWNRFQNFVTGLPEYQERTLLERKGLNTNIKKIRDGVQGLENTISKIGSNFVITIIIITLIIASTLAMPYSKSSVLGIPVFSAFYMILAVILIFYLAVINLWR